MLIVVLFALLQLAQRPQKFEPVWLVDALANVTGYNPHPVKLFSTSACLLLTSSRARLATVQTTATGRPTIWRSSSAALP
jgi:hypothetical protein